MQRNRLEKGKREMIHGSTWLHEFTRDDGSIVVIEYNRTPYDAGCSSGLPENCYPPEGGDIDEWEVTAENGKQVELTDAEARRAEDEINADFDPMDLYYEEYDE